jgi:hypothetical protein
MGLGAAAADSMCAAIHRNCQGRRRFDALCSRAGSLLLLRVVRSRPALALGGSRRRMFVGASVPRGELLAVTGDRRTAVARAASIGLVVPRKAHRLHGSSRNATAPVDR